MLKFLRQHWKRFGSAGALSILVFYGVFSSLPAYGASVVWDNGGGDGLWSTAANWSNDRVPRSGDEVIFDATSNTASTIDAGFGGSVGKITVNAGYTSTITLQESFTVVATGGQFGTITLNSGTFDANGNTNTVTGVVVVNGGTYLAGSALQTFNGGLEVLAGTFTSGSGSVDINGNLTFTGGVIDGGSASFSVSNDFINTAGTLTAGTSTFTFDGTTTVIDVPTTQTFFNLTFAPTTAASIKHISPNDTLIATGTLTLTEGNINRGTVEARGDITQASTFDGGTGSLNITGTAAQTFTGSATTSAGTLPALTINKTGGTLSLAGTIRTTNNWKYLAGTVVAGTSQVVFGGTMFLEGSHTLADVTLNATNVNLSEDTVLTVTGQLTSTAGAVNNGTLAVQGNILQTSTSGAGSGTFLINGTGSQTLTGSATTTAGDLPNIEINKASGTLFLAGLIRSTTGKWDLIAGTTDPGGSVLVKAGGFIDGTQSFNELDIRGATILGRESVITLNSTFTHTSSTLNVGGDLIVNGLTTLTAGSIIGLGQVHARGDLTLASAYTGGAGYLVMDGTGAQTLTGSATVSAGSLPNFEIDKASGTLTLAGTIRTGLAWKYTAGTLNATGSTVVFGASLTVMGTHTLDGVTFNTTGTVTVTKDSILTVTGTLTLMDGSINSGTVIAQGDITQASIFDGGTGALLISGTGSRSFAGSATTTAGNLPDLTINKTGGTLTLSGTIRTTHSWDYTAGTVDPDSSTLVMAGGRIAGTQTLSALDIRGATLIDKETTVTLNSTFTHTSGIFTLNGVLVVLGDATFTAGSTVGIGQIEARANVTETTGYTGGAGRLVFNGTGAQTLTGSASVTAGALPNVLIDKASGTLTLTGTVRVNADWVLANGTMDAGTSTFVMAGGNIIGTFSLNDLDVRAATTILHVSAVTVAGNYTNTAGALTVHGNMVVQGSTSLTAGSIAGKGLVEIRGNITQEAAFATGVGTLVINGTGAQSFTGNATTTAGQLPLLTIDKASGTLTLIGTIRTGQGLRYVQGTVDATTNDSTIVFGGASATLRTFGLSGTPMTFDNVTFQSSTTTLDGTLNVDGNLSIITSGTLNTGVRDSSILLAGDWTNTSSGGFTSNLSVVTFDGSGTQTVNTGGTGATQDFWHVIVDKAAGSVVLSTSAALISGNFYIKTGTFDVSASNLAVTVLGNWKNEATFTAQSGTVTLQGTQSNTLEPGTSSFFNLTLNKTSATAGLDDVYLIGTNPLNITGAFTISDGEFIQDGLDMTVSGATTLTVASSAWTNRSTGDITLGGTVTNAGIILWDANNGTAGDTDDIVLASTVGGTQRTLSGAGTYTWRDLAVTDMNASVAITANSSTDTSNNAGITFNATNLYKIWDGGGVDNNWSTLANWSSDSLPVAGDVVLFDTTSAKDVTMNNALATVSGFVINGYTGILTHGTNTLTVTNDFVQTSGTFTGGASAMTVSGAFLQTGGTFTAPSGTFTLAKGMIYSAGTFTPGSNTVTFGGTGAYIDASAIAFNNVIITSGTAASNKEFKDNTTLVVTGTLTLTEGNLNQTLVPAGGTIAARGDIAQASTFDGGTGTLVVDGTASPTFTGSATSATGVLPRIIFNKTGGTLTLAGTIRTTRNWIYTAGTIDPGTSTVVFAGVSLSGTHTLNAIEIRDDLTVVSGTTLTAASASITTSTAILNLQGDVIVTGTTTLTDGLINGFGLAHLRGDISQASTFDGGTSLLVIDGTGAQAFSGTATTTAGTLPNLEINKASGTLTLSGTIRTTNDWEYLAGTLAAGTSTLVFAGGSIIGTQTLNNVEIRTAETRQEFGDTLTIGGTLLLASAVPFRVSGTTIVVGAMTLTDGTIVGVGTLEAQGDINQGTLFDGGAGHIVINGTGAQVLTGSGSATLGQLPYITINKASGTLTLASIIRTTNSWVYTTGTMSAGTSTMVFAAALSLIGSQTFNNVTFSGTTTSYSLSPATVITVPGVLTLTDGLIDVGTVTAQGDISQASTFDGGTGTLTINGTGAQAFSGTATTTAGLLPIILINKSSGTLTLSGTIRTANNWTLQSGTLDPGTSTLVFAGGAISGTQSFYSLDIRGATVVASGTALTLNNALTISAAVALIVNGTMTVAGLTTLTDGTIDGLGTLGLRGDINQGTLFDGGVGHMIIDGTGAQLFTGSGSTTLGQLPKITINKTSGTLTLASIIRTGNHWIYTAGTLAPGASTLHFFAAQSIVGVQTLANVTFDGAGVSHYICGCADLTVTGTLTLTEGNIDVGNVNAEGDILQASTFDGGTGMITINGAGAQLFTGSATTAAGVLPDISITKTTGTLTLAGTIRTVAQGVGAWDYNSGTVAPGTSSLIFSGANTISGTQTLNNLELQGANASFQLDDSITLTVTGTLTLTDGNIDGNGAGGTTLDAQGDVTHSATFDGGTGLLKISGAAARTINMIGAGQFPNLTLDAANVTLNGPTSGTTTFDNNLTIADGTFAVGDGDITITGGLLQTGGIMTGGAGTTTTTGYAEMSGGTFTGAAGTMHYNGPFAVTGGAYTAPSGSMLLGGGVILSGGSFVHNSGTVTLDFDARSVFASSNPTLNNLIINPGNNDAETINSTATVIVIGTLTLTEGAINTGTIEAQGPVVHATTFDGGSGLIEVTGATVRTISLVADGELPGLTLNTADVTINGDATGTVTFERTLTVTAGIFTNGAGVLAVSGEFIENGGTFNGGSGAVTVTGNTLLNGGAFTATTGDLSLTRDLIVAPGVTFAHNSGSVILTAAGSAVVDVDTSLTFNNLETNWGSSTISNSIATGDTLLTLGTLDLTNGVTDGGTFEAQGNVVISSVGYDGGNTVLRFSGGNAQILTIQSGADDRYNGNIEINKTAGTAVTVTPDVAGEGLTLDPTALQTLTVTSGTIDFTSATLTATGLVSVAGGTLIQGTLDFTLVPFTISSGTFTPGTGAMIISDDFTQSGGTFTAPASTLTVGGDFLHSAGTFTHNSGSVTLNGTSQIMTGSTTFNNFTKSDTVGSTLTLPAGATQTFLGTLTLGGDGTTDMLLRSSTNGVQALIDPQGTRSIFDLNVKDNSNVNTLVVTCTGCVNSGNLTNWSIPASGGSGGGGGGGGVVVSNVNLTTPNGGEDLEAGQAFTVSFSTTGSDIATIRLLLSTDGGLSYPTVITTTTSSSYSWVVPDVSTAAARIKAEGLDSNGDVIDTDVSNANFNIQGTAEVPGLPEAGPVPSADPTATGLYSPSVATNFTTTINADKSLSGGAGTLCESNTLIKSSALTTVYYCGADGKRYAFPNEKTYFTWYSDFSNITTLTPEAVADIPLGGNVTYRPGVRMIKIQSDARVYVVSRGGILRYVEGEEVARALYGSNWSQFIDDVADVFFANYTLGRSIMLSDVDYDNIQAVTVVNEASQTSSTPSTPSTSSCSSDTTFTQFLTFDSVDTDVRPLQELLLCLGYLSSDLTASGYFGENTAAAVSDFQAANGLDAVGYVGPQTRDILNTNY